MPCPTLTAFTPEQTDQAAAELESLPEGAVLDAIVADWIGMRDQVRAACT